MEGPWLSMGPEGGVINGTLVCWLIRGTWGRNCDDTPPMAVCVIGIVCWVPHWGSVASPVGDGPSEEDPVYSRFPLESGISGWIPMGPYNSRITSSTVSSDSLWAESRSKVRLSHTLLLQLHVRVFMFYNNWHRETIFCYSYNLSSLKNNRETSYFWIRFSKSSYFHSTSGSVQVFHDKVWRMVELNYQHTLSMF